MQYFDKEGNLKHRVRASQPFKDTNNFFVNDQNFMMATEYKDNKLNLYRLKGTDPEVLMNRPRAISNNFISTTSIRGNFSVASNRGRAYNSQNAWYSFHMT